MGLISNMYEEEIGPLLNPKPPKPQTPNPKPKTLHCKPHRVEGANSAMP